MRIGCRSLLQQSLPLCRRDARRLGRQHRVELRELYKLERSAPSAFAVAD
jgi:hypothetical protein